VRGCQTNLAESLAKLLLESVVAKQYGSKKAIAASQRGNWSRKPYANSGNSIGGQILRKSYDIWVLLKLAKRPVVQFWEV